MKEDTQFYVINRKGEKEPVYFDKIKFRLTQLCEMQPELDKISTINLAKKVIDGLYPGVTTSELDTLAAETAAYLVSTHPQYDVMAARIEVSNLHKNAPKTFSEAMKLAYNNRVVKTGTHAPLIAKHIYEFIEQNKEELDAMVNKERDFYFDYFGFKTLASKYLFRIKNEIIETPQYMFLRVSIGIHCGDLSAIRETYDYMSNLMFTHATPTLFNSGTPHPQMSSCFLLTMKDDSIDGIYETVKRCALISKYAGGIGLSISNIRSKDSYIVGTSGSSNGIVPMLRVFNDTARYVDQGGNKRNGSFAIYLEPWHSDITDFLDLKKNNGKEENRARDLFYALWIPDLFMDRVEKDLEWSLFCPNEAKGLCDVYGEEFNQLYQKYEKTSGLARKTMKARDLWWYILDSQIETGTPYMLYKDSCNNKSNQKNLGTIRCSNLCTEILEYTSPDEVAVCNLSSISLPKFVKDGVFDHQELFKVVRVIARNLNKIIDLNFYPIPEAEKSNKRHRPIGIGIQGLADLFVKLRLAWESDEARTLNKEIFETIYYAALYESKELSKIYGPYETFPGSPVSQGILQYHMWGVVPSERWNWSELIEEIKVYGVRNSLITAPMPTATTSQILGNQEAFYPYHSNIFARRVKSGDFIVVNKSLVYDLEERNLWSTELKQKIIENNGSIQNIDEIPTDIKNIYKTVWEIPQMYLGQLSIDRGAFIDQSQSFNLFIEQPTVSKLNAFHFFMWKNGAKTGMYYLRREAVSEAIKVTVDKKPETKKKTKEENASDNEPLICKLNDPDCMTCSS